jgi:hypothetical protein
MGDGASYQPDRRWDPARQGFLAFADDPLSGQLNAALGFFPSPRDGSLEEVCTQSNYQTPDVELTSFADSTAFHDAFDNTSPAGGSPTLPALQGTLLYALTVALNHPEADTVVVLVTDGQPQFWNNITSQYEPGCTDNDFNHVASVALSFYQGTPTAQGTISIKTYVIGISNDVELEALQTSLDVVAEAGGTTPARMVQDADPNNSPLISQAAMTTLMRRALEQIRDELITCDVPLPDPPSGQSLVPDQLNLSYVTANNSRNALAYSADCADGTGWRYDNLDAPTKIELCSETCDAVRTVGASSLDAAFGCPTEGLGGAGGASGQGGQGGQAPAAGGAGGGAGAGPVGGAPAAGGATSAGAPSTAGTAGVPATGGSAGTPSAAGSAGAPQPSTGGTAGTAGAPSSAGTSNAGAGGG